MLATRWLERLTDVLRLAPECVFPSDDLLDHIPALLHEIGGYLRAPEDQAIAANTGVIVKARELGRLRYEQKASVHQLLREYDVLAGILETFVTEETAVMADPPSAAACLGIFRRINQAVRSLMQTTVDTFVQEYSGTIARQTSHLESFNRMISHELRTPLATVRFAAELLASAGEVDGSSRQRLETMIKRNADRALELVRTIERLTVVEEAPDGAVQTVAVHAVATEAARQLRDMASARNVAIRLPPVLPLLEIDAARLELILVNLFSNAIKYSNPAHAERFVVLEEAASRDDRSVTLCVRDNGIGIPDAARSAIFERFYRAHPERNAELGADGLGLGLAIVKDCVLALGGEIEVESAEGDGTAFYLTFPRRRRPSAP